MLLIQTGSSAMFVDSPSQETTTGCTAKAQNPGQPINSSGRDEQAGQAE
jgi:hypothetical protein